MSKKPLSFEAKLAKLESLVEELKLDDISLQDTITKYETGIGLIQDCQNEINSFEEKLIMLSKESQDSLKKQSVSFDSLTDS